MKYDTIEAITPEGTPTSREGQITLSRSSVITTADTSPTTIDVVTIQTLVFFTVNKYL